MFAVLNQLAAKGAGLVCEKKPDRGAGLGAAEEEGAHPGIAKGGGSVPWWAPGRRQKAAGSRDFQMQARTDHPPAEAPAPVPRRQARLALWMSASVALFVAVGSLALALALQHNLDREERRSFEELARTNARFLEHERLPRSPRLAAELGQIIGARVFFQTKAGGGLVGAPQDNPESGVLDAPCDGRVRVLADGAWVVGIEEKGGGRVFFARPPQSAALALNRLDTWLVLGGFWALSLALGWWLARRVTGPLQSLAKSLPLVGTDDHLPALPTGRSDEIGRLAQTLAQTHASLRQERELRRRAERHAFLGKMTASLAHEVRNPLTAIRLHAQLLEEAGPEEAALSLELIKAEAERIENLVAQWVSHARPAPPQMKEVDLRALLRDAVRLLEPQAAHAGTRLDFPAENAGPLILRADAGQLRQVAGNLLLNAIQAMPPGGTATVSLEQDAGAVAVRVEDEGPGFGAEALLRAGEPFYSEKEGGMGLGLAVVRDICLAHGGSFSFGNRPQGGSWVRLELPRTADAGPADSSQSN